MTIYLCLYLHLIWGEISHQAIYNHPSNWPIILNEVYDEFMSLEPEVRQAPYGMSNTWVLHIFSIENDVFFLVFSIGKRGYEGFSHWYSTDLRICHVLFCHVLSKCHLLRWPTHQEKVLVVLHDTPCLQPRSFKMEPQKTMVSKRNLLFEGLIFRFHAVNHRWFLCWDWKHPCQELTEFLNADGLEERGFLLYLGWRQIWVDKFRLQP